MSDEENSVANPFFANEIDFFGIDPDDLIQGVPVNGWNSRSSLRSTSPKYDGNLNDIVFANPMVPAYSPKLQQALADASVGVDDIQYLPVRIVQSTGKEATGYAISNIITRIAALDRERCFILEEDELEVDPLTGQPKISCIGKIALFGEPLGNHDVARLVEYSWAELVSERFQKVFREGKFTGAICSPLPVS